jgi:hypothetical protein
MNHNPEKNSLHEKILQSIKTGEVKMRPKWHFVLRGALVGIGTVLVALTLLYIISFIIFILHQNGTLFAPGLGVRGLGIFLFSLPWILIVITLIFIAVLEILVRRYAFAYRRPLLYSALAVVFLVLVGGVIIARTSLHPKFFIYAREGRLPIAGQLYRGYGMQRLPNIHPCIITEINENGFVAEDIRNERVVVMISSDTEFPFGTNFSIGDRVLVLGDRSNTTISATAIRKIEDTMYMRQRPGTSSPRVHIRFK